MNWRVTEYTAGIDEGKICDCANLTLENFRGAIQLLKKNGIVSLAPRDRRYRVRLGQPPPRVLSDYGIRALNALLGVEIVDEKHPWVVRASNICGGVPVLAMTRVPVDAIVSLYDAGQGPEQILQAFAHLTPFHIDRALHFHLDRSAIRVS